METTYYLFAGCDLDGQTVNRKHYLQSFDNVKDAVECWSQQAREYRWDKIGHFDDGDHHEVYHL